MGHKPRQLVESYDNFAPTKLTVDREAGIIYGVRVLGPESKNSHGVAGVESTLYARTAHEDEKRMCEGITCNLNHVAKKSERRVQDAIGEFHNGEVRTEADGRPATYANLHYLKSHPMANTLVEAAERGMSCFGMSHDAYSAKERVDRKTRRLVIESLAKLNSIDLVIGPATNRNLQESQEDKPMKISLKSVLESLKNLTTSKKAWVTHLTEDAKLTPFLNAERVLEGEESAPEEATEMAFQAAIAAIVADETMDVAAKTAKIRKLLKAHESIKADGDPAAPVDDAAMTADEPVKAQESQAEIKTLTDKVKLLESREQVRQLCESEGFAPKTHQINALIGLTTAADRKAMIADLKKTVGVGAPRSGVRVTESTKDTNGLPKTVADFANSLKS